MPAQQGVSHVALTVTDAARSADLYARLFDGQIVFDDTDDVGPIKVLVAASSLMLGFRTHAKTKGKDTFDPARVGLDHIAFAVSDETELEKWQSKLDELGVKHSGIQQSPFGLHLNAKDPDNIQIEWFVGATG
jgi:catechol 2,3-dioxygenase-like lactoylglutathione lyase family enzyme